MLLAKNMRKCTVCSFHSSPSSRGLSRERKTKALHAGLLQQQEGDGAAAGLKLRSELSGSSLHGTFLPAFLCVNKPLTQEAQSTPGDQLFFNCLRAAARPSRSPCAFSRLPLHLQ